MYTDLGDKNLWRALQAGERGASDSLVARYRPWALSVADRIHRRVAGLQVPRDDLRQSAVVGLLEALPRFDPGRGIPFEGFAMARVRGAVFNEVRQCSPSRESSFAVIRTRERLQSVRAHAEGEEGDVLDQVVGDIVALGLAFLLDHQAGQSHDPLCAAQEYTERSMMNTRLRAAMQRLPERSRLLIEAHYFRHLPFKKLAEDLGVSKGRVSQLHHAALGDLRRALATPSPR
ncbi:sigma-70 family RNA polymerase sigma factor [Stenotrophomonas maltophilia]|nr:sigma-70 family RNA polymerase sigma factor [Stenotrophomonas maltophilia]